ncbi:MAG: VCBS repeat-containing protein [Planctomycetes bacterium]|nr:VCBS repeat-containing protein [Planctomycetota bacterium]
MRHRQFSFPIFLGRSVLFGMLLTVAGVRAETGPPAVIGSTGAVLRGNEFRYDCGFELLDWNGDGRLDFFLPNTSLMSFVVYQNDGTRDEPRFEHALPYPVNLTETAPQTLEHIQSFATCDLNGDGLFDLVVFDGQLRMIYNTGSAYAPNHWHLAKLPQFFPGSQRMIAENSRYSTGPESMFWNKGIFARQVLTFTIADWDGDGLDDLLVCRTKHEAPGVVSAGGAEQWTGWGRVMVTPPRHPAPPADALAPPLAKGGQGGSPLSAAPERGLYFYRNTGTRTEPAFDEGIELRTADGLSLAAPNPAIADVDGDGVLDVLSAETRYTCNAFRVDWPTAEHVLWFRRPSADQPNVLEPARPLTDAAGTPIAAGMQLRLADFRGRGAPDLFVMDGGLRGTIRWYRNQAATKAAPLALEPPAVLRGRDFLRFDFMAQPLVVDWFAPDSRDLILHGNTDAHCKWSLRRTALYRNTASSAAAPPEYELAGHFNYRGDPALVPTSLEDRPYDVYGTAVWVPETDDGEKRLVMSVSGRLFLFSKLADDGLTFLERRAIELPAERNRRRGWQELDVNVPEPVRYIRIGNDRNGMGNLRDSFLHIVRFEALSGGTNVATGERGVTVADQNDEPSPHYRVQRPERMFDPANEPSDAEPNFTTFGYYIGPAVVDLKQPVKLDRLRFLLSDREQNWYTFRLPFYWQGALFRQGTEQGEPWYQYTVEVSADGQNWTTIADTMPTEMMRSFPCALDWNGDGRFDLVLGVLNGRGIWPATKEYRLYLNTGTNDEPQFSDYQPLCDEAGKPLELQAFWYHAYALQCGVIARDLDGDGRRDVVVEGFQNPELWWYRNVSEGAQQLRFQRMQQVGHPRPILYPSRYTYFYAGDVDGDALPDLLNSNGGVPTFFKGQSATAPSPITDLSAAGAKTNATVAWSRPPGAARYSLRWSEHSITELDWPRLPETTAAYASAEGAIETFELRDVPQGKLLHLAVKSLNAAGESSALSNSVEIATRPLERIVLRNGPASAGIPGYEGCVATCLDEHQPDTAAAQPPKLLTARAPGAEKQKVVLLRFAGIPASGALEQAFLELSVAADTNQLQDVATLGISCNAAEEEWDPSTVTWNAASPGRPWKTGELASGGRFLSMAQPQWTVAAGRVLRWDVSDALRGALAQGRTPSFLIRVANTGNYVAGQGYTFHGTGADAIEERPRLILVRRTTER